MASQRREQKQRPSTRPATTVEGRENQLIAHAIDLAERQLRDGSASAQVISHYLKLGSTRERLEQERLIKENELLSAKVEQLASAKRMEEIYEKALNAMRSYAGQETEDDYDD